MSSIRRTSRHSLCALITLGLVGCITTRAGAQQAPTSSPDVIAVASGFDIVNDYMFRGVRQNSTGVAMWPFVDLAVTPYSSDGTFKRLAIDVGFWNSVNTGDTGSGGPTGKAWYESRFYGSVGLQFAKGVSVATSYTAYTSPNDMFTTAKEIGVKLSVDDRAALGRAAVRPYALAAFEVGASAGEGQLDGGQHPGTYLELGVTPGYAARRVTFTVPVKVGLSLRDYYEFAGKDNRFGFASVGGIVTVPLGGTSRIGRLNVHGGVEVEALGEATKVFNGRDRTKVIASLGFGLTR